MTLTHGELFAGIGGFGLGFDRAGMKTVWHVEIDPRCQEILHRHNPDGLILSDVCECGKDNLPRVDVISFGSPCQDLSVAGKRKGFQDGTRSNLFFEAIRIVDELKPAFAVWENVPGALSSHSGRDFAAVLFAFRECGARDIAWRILDAQYFGVAQRRRRVFVVADFGGERAAEILFESESMSGDIETGRKAGEEVALSITTGVGNRNHGTADNFIIANTLIAWEMQHASEAYRESGEIAPTLQSRMGTGGNNVPMVGVRRLTPIECARLQGFPDDWCAGQADTTQYRQYGNAVAVPVVEWIGSRIVKAEVQE